MDKVLWLIKCVKSGLWNFYARDFLLEDNKTYQLKLIVIKSRHYLKKIKQKHQELVKKKDVIFYKDNSRMHVFGN